MNIIQPIVLFPESDQPLVIKPEGSAKLDDNATSTGQPLVMSLVPFMPEKRILELVLDILQRRDTYEIFAEPVDPKEARAIYDLAKKVFHVLKTDFENFESEFSETRRRSSRRPQGEDKGLNFNSSPRFATNVRSSCMTTDVSSKGTRCSLNGPSNPRRNIQGKPRFSCTRVDTREHDFPPAGVSWLGVLHPREGRCHCRNAMEAGHYWLLPRGQVLGMMGVGLEVAGSFLEEGVAVNAVGELGEILWWVVWVRGVGLGIGNVVLRSHGSSCDHPPWWVAGRDYQEWVSSDNEHNCQTEQKGFPQTAPTDDAASSRRNGSDRSTLPQLVSEKPNPVRDLHKRSLPVDVGDSLLAKCLGVIGVWCNARFHECWALVFESWIGP
ncbi:hypothetical protein TEA_000763 [Camellia sinensis var. sinensis]|uniref:Uncharacterized protein n=1 Tax=Camellia sinensis var. sinensis TaxID=542762 RepID=A0A4S4DMV3_CAMSN|nr:hypothetical protein TEA_000763 [Camellia sinensis var. sinensis]